MIHSVAIPQNFLGTLLTSFMKEEIGKPVTCSSSHSKTMTLSVTFLNKLFSKPIPN